MAITQSALAHAMARDLIRAAPADVHIKRAWVWSQHGFVDPDRDYVELSILHDEVDDETGQRFLKAVTDMMEDRYADANKSLYTFASDNKGDRDLDQWIRSGAEEVRLTGE